MPNLIRSSCPEDIKTLVDNILPEDLREITEGAGVNPVLSCFIGLLSSNTVSFFTPDSRLAGMAGVSDDGCIWMHCTKAVKDIPILFCKEARKWVESLQKPILYNRADIRNKLHLKLLKHLGFKFINVVPSGPNNIYFVEFVKLWIH